MGKSNPSRDRLLPLEGLRGVAALIVVFSHLRLTFWAALDDDMLRWFSDGQPGHSVWGAVLVGTRSFISAFWDGNCAVWIFWVMSAFVLALKFFQASNAADARSYLVTAALKRYPRLALPALFSVLIAYLLLAQSLIQSPQLATELGPLYAHGWLGSFFSFPANFKLALVDALWYTFFNFREALTYNAVLWSMEPELIGSLFLFLALGFFSRLRRVPLWFSAIALLLILWSERYWLAAFLAGIELAQRYVQKPELTVRGYWSHPVVFALVLSALLCLVGLPNFAGLLHLLCAIGMTTWIAFHPVGQRWFSQRPFLYLGRISFGLYLMHLLVICSLARPLFHWFGAIASAPLAKLLTSLVLLIVSVVAGHFGWMLADRPAVKFSTWLASKVRGASAFLAMRRAHGPV